MDGKAVRGCPMSIRGWRTSRRVGSLLLTLLILVTNGPLGTTSLCGQALAPAVPGRKSATPVISRRGASAGTTSQLKVMAVVNQEQITRQELAREVLRRYGSEVLESMVNKKLILQACQQRQIVVTNKDVEEEIARIASRFGLSVERWLSMLQKDRELFSSSRAHFLPPVAPVYAACAAEESST